jgi:hypothetical protein
MTNADLAYSFLLPFLLLIIGAGLILLVRPEPKDKLKLPTTNYFAYVPPNLVNPIRMGGWILLAGTVVFTGLIWAGRFDIGDVSVNPASVGTELTTMTPKPSVGISLVSVSFIENDWQPRVIDLRTASTIGIPIEAGHSLRFTDLFVNIPKETVGDEIQVEVYDSNGKLIGATTGQRTLPGIMKLDEINPTSYLHPNVQSAWQIQPDWKKFDIYLYLYENKRNIATSLTTILANSNGTAWMIAPPYINITALIYSVNNGDEQVLDMRSDPYPVIQANPDDIFTIHSIWYKAQSGDNNQTIKIGVSFNDGVNEGLDFQDSDQLQFEEGNHELVGFTPLTWTVPTNAKWAGVYLYRGDNVVLDFVTIMLSNEN